MPMLDSSKRKKRKKRKKRGEERRRRRRLEDHAYDTGSGTKKQRDSLVCTCVYVCVSERGWVREAAFYHPKMNQLIAREKACRCKELIY
jgi:hypothetical protein